ncbi:hypothetical protein [Sphingobacterium bambusae]|uniref:Uncharacterized protein n=1 Tax=Sphingobacterium bambusae TaxID=662858 RepID=A0ABW6BI26_9SPHI|nr:hypothetical protein [Sphingobacterium bambusae]WPL49098.1 hypothetical protein SCB77_01295 [Sphingobacterium bambusae]
MRQYHIPKQVKGKQIVISESRNYSTQEEVTGAFHHARSRLGSINQWQDFAGTTSATFQLFDELGHQITRFPKIGDYVRIDIPGPGSFIGRGYDWVKVTQFDDRPEDGYILITLQPSVPPATIKRDAEVAHFFKATASTNIEIKVQRLCLQVNYFGRNEETNNTSALLMENIRNSLIGFGAKLGFSYPQWKKLVKGLLAT